MAKIDFKGIDEYAKMLAILEKDQEKIVTKAVYEGAAIVADEIKAGLKELPIEEGENGLPPYAEPGEKLKGVTRRQKGDLIDSFGTAPIENDNGYINTKVGMDGYGSVQTAQYPKGTPNAMLMRAVESGTSFREKHPVFRPAVNRSRKRCEAKMEETINKEIEKTMK